MLPQYVSADGPEALFLRDLEAIAIKHGKKWVLHLSGESGIGIGGVWVSEDCPNKERRQELMAMLYALVQDDEAFLSAWMKHRGYTVKKAKWWKK